MTGNAMRSWCAAYQWGGKAEFLVGTVLVRAAGSQQEVEAAVAAELTRALGTILPDEIVRPTLVRLIPGSIIFVSNGEEN